MIKLRKKVSIFFGTRPEYLKIKPILKHLSKSSFELVYVSQHQNIKENFNYDRIFKISDLLNIDRLNSITSSIISNKNNITRNDYVLVQGDTQTAMSIALSSFFKKKTIFHLEAGLRSNDKYSPFPEEINRKIISTLSDHHLCPTSLSKKNLQNENIKRNIYITGNTSLDNLLKYKNKAEYTDTVVITLHRRENFKIYSDWLNSINNVAKKFLNIKFYFVLHPNPYYKKFKHKYKNLIFLEHMSHENLLSYIIKAKLLITDSGGIQEEGSFLNKKIIVCRKETERPEGIETNHLYLCKKPKNLTKLFESLIVNYKINKKSPYGDGYSGKKISLILKKVCR